VRSSRREVGVREVFGRPKPDVDAHADEEGQRVEQVGPDFVGGDRTVVPLRVFDDSGAWTRRMWFQLAPLLVCLWMQRESDVPERASNH
jgi:hypothetical protein